ncbi:hypothetical protein Q4R24_15670 [Morganella morganii]
MMETTVIHVNFKDENKPVLSTVVEDKKSWQQERCKHHSVIINEQYRQVTCKHCNCVIDAFDVLLSRCNDAEHVVREIVELMEKREELRKSVDELLKAEKNTKARLRSARTDLLFTENKMAQLKGEVG